MKLGFLFNQNEESVMNPKITDNNANPAPLFQGAWAVV